MSVMLSAANRRFTDRRAARMDCQVVTERGFKLVARQSLDLSPEGMLVLSDAKVVTGEGVIVSFRAPRTKAWIDAEATVVRVGHGRRPTDVGHVLGLAFEWLPSRDRALLQASLVGLPFPLQARPRRVERLPMIRRA